MIIFSNTDVIVIKAMTWFESTQKACKMTDVFKEDIISITQLIELCRSLK